MLRNARLTGSGKLHRSAVAIPTGGKGPFTSRMIATVCMFAPAVSCAQPPLR